MSLRSDNLISAEEARKLGIVPSTPGRSVAHQVVNRKSPTLKPPAPSRETRGPWLDGILSVPEFRGELGPEDTISAGLRGRLIDAEHDGRSRCVWTHVPCEGSRGRAYMAKLATMGVVWSPPDWWFMWQIGCGVIELKQPHKSKEPVQLLTKGQAEHRAWCAHHGVRHAVCVSVEDAWATLVEWGAVRG